MNGIKKLPTPKEIFTEITLGVIDNPERSTLGLLRFIEEIIKKTIKTV